MLFPAGSGVIAIYGPDATTRYCIPLYLGRVSAGYPSPAEDFIEGQLDLNQHLIQHPAATFFVRVAGDSMTGAGIHPGDLLIVDRALEAKSGRVVIAVLNGELVVKRLKRTSRGLYLVAENPAYRPIEVTEAMGFCVWGVVTTVIHSI